MNNIYKIVHIIAGAASTILLLLPCLSEDVAANFIFLTLSGSIILAVQAILLLGTCKKRGAFWWIQSVLFVASMVAYGKYYIPGGENKSECNEKLRIVSCNVENFHIKSDTLKKAAKYINSLDADIICLQERPHDNLLHRDSIRAAFPAHRHFCTNDREDEVANVAILSKYPLSNIEAHYFDPGHNKMITADVETPQGTVTLWNIHLQTTGGDPKNFRYNAHRRNKQAKGLKAMINRCKNPAIVCGDFNDTPASYVYRTLAKGMNDCYATSGEKFSGSYQAAGAIFRIDYILCNKQLQPVSYRLLKNTWSDHKIQFAEITHIREK